MHDLGVMNALDPRGRKCLSDLRIGAKTYFWAPSIAFIYGTAGANFRSGYSSPQSPPIPNGLPCEYTSSKRYLTGDVGSAPDGSPVPPADFDSESMSAEDQNYIRRHMDWMQRLLFGCSHYVFETSFHVDSSHRVSVGISKFPIGSRCVADVTEMCADVCM